MATESTECVNEEFINSETT